MHVFWSQSSYQFVHCCIDQDGIAPFDQTVQLRARVYKQEATYRWQYKNGKNWSNITNWGNYDSPVLNVPVTAENDGKQYRCVVKLPTNTYFNSTPVTIAVKPEIIKQPESVTLESGKIARFTVDVTGNNLTYQWQRNTGSGWVNSGQTGYQTPILFVTANAEYEGLYRCMINSGNGLKVISDPAELTIKPTITKQPASATLEIGKTAIFSVEATGKDLTYQWEIYGENGWKNSNADGNKTGQIACEVLRRVGAVKSF